MHGAFPKSVRWRGRLREYVWWPVAQITAGFHLLPPLAAIVLFLLLVKFGQLREIYVSYLNFDGVSVVQIVCAFLAFALLSAALWIFHYALSPMQAEILFQGSAEPYTGSNVAILQRVSAFALSAVPWAGLIAGLLVARSEVEAITEKLKRMAEPFPPLVQELPAKVLEVARFEERIWPAAIVLALAGIAVCYGLHRCNVSHHRQRWWQAILLTIGVVLTIVGLAPVAGESAVSFYRALGPLATLALSFLFFFCILGAVAYSSKQVAAHGPAFPAVTLALLAVGVGAFFGVSTSTLALCVLGVSGLFIALAVFLRLDPALAILGILIAVIAACTVGRERFLAETMTISDEAVDQKHLADAFKAWLNTRSDRASRPTGTTPYPVFIIAVEGGGIYAAAAASAFLGGLQDRCPSFAQHVFAISGVSGGAIGATSFQVLANARPQASEATPCRAPTDAQRALMKPLADIMKADHFSPVVASILPDFIGLKWDRVDGLETSFLKSIEEAAGTGTVKAVRSDFRKHWNESSTAPALVLNATWAETGYRVGFAPFELKNDPSFFGFYDKAILGGAKDVKEPLTLMKAAAVSARFPGILPPYAVLRKEGNAPEVRWNFVDGGYSDPSGSATALQIYRALDDLRHKEALEFEPWLLVLTNAARELDFKKINGTAFRDLIGPVDAVLQARKALAGQAIARLTGYFSTRDRERLKFIELQDEVFNLPLGWKISSATYDIVSLLVGRADLCIGKDNLKDKPAESRILHENSCKIAEIEHALSPLPQ